MLLYILHLQQLNLYLIGTGAFPAIVGQTGLGQTTLFEHEVGTDQANADGSTTTVTSFINSFDFDIKPEGTDGEFFLIYEKIYTRL